MNNMNDFQQKFFFWIFVFFGFYLFFRGLINYMSLKYRPAATAAAANSEYPQGFQNRFWFLA
jgi:hypothetical protein